MNIKKNDLHYYIDLLRMDDTKQRTPKETVTCVTALNNVIRTMQLSRHNKICGEDFSRLDFGNIPFNGIHWSMNGDDPSCFDGCKLNELNFISGHTSDVTDVSWSPDGKYILTRDSENMIILWDVVSGLIICAIPEYEELPDDLSSKERSLIEKFRTKTDKEDGSVDNGKYRLTWSLLTNTAELCDTETGTCLTLSGHSKPVCSGVFSFDGRYCLTGSVDKTAKIWDTRTGKCLKTLSGHSIFNQAVVRSDGKYCITNSTDGSLKMWKLEAGKCIWQKESYTLSINYLLKKVPPLFVFKGEFRNAMLKLKVHEQSICSAAFLPDGEHCMIGLADGTINEFDIETGELTSKKKTNKGTVPSVVYSPDEKHILVIQSKEPIEIWDLRKENIKTIENTKNVKSVAVSCDGKLCLTGFKKGKVKLWDIKKRKCLNEFKIQEGSVDSLAFSPDGKCFIAASNKGTAALLKIKSGKLLKTFDLHDAVGTKRWNFPYVAVMDKNTCEIYKSDCTDPDSSAEKEYILYNADRMHITNCSFKDISADDATKEIISQYSETAAL